MLILTIILGLLAAAFAALWLLSRKNLKSAVEELRRKTLTGRLAQVPLFYGRGAWDESRMTLLDRTLCRGLQRAVARKDPATLEPWEAALLSARGTVCDWTDRASLAPLLDYLAGSPTSPKG